MFVAPGDFDKAYGQIRTDSLKVLLVAAAAKSVARSCSWRLMLSASCCAAPLQGDCTVLIFVTPDTDALCACWILTSMLRSDFIRYKMVPVADLTDLYEAKVHASCTSCQTPSPLFLPLWYLLLSVMVILQYLRGTHLRCGSRNC